MVWHISCKREGGREREAFYLFK